jgi:hypothetical protein
LRWLALKVSSVRGVLDGLTNKEIALNLNVSESSVKAVIQELFQKAGVRTRSQLVRIAIEKHSSDWLRPRPQGWMQAPAIAAGGGSCRMTSACFAFPSLLHTSNHQRNGLKNA